MGNWGDVVELVRVSGLASLGTAFLLLALVPGEVEIPHRRVVFRVSVCASERYLIFLNASMRLMLWRNRIFVVSPCFDCRGPLCRVCCDFSHVKKGFWLRCRA